MDWRPSSTSPRSKMPSGPLARRSEPPRCHHPPCCSAGGQGGCKGAALAVTLGGEKALPKWNIGAGSSKDRYKAGPGIPEGALGSFGSQRVRKDGELVPMTWRVSDQRPRKRFRYVKMREVVRPVFESETSERIASTASAVRLSRCCRQPRPMARPPYCL
eukprot:scaffold2663_cov256-Pinguiococcus_pyrenoidosus.AAC.2